MFHDRVSRMIIPDCKDNRFAPYGGYPRRGFYYPDYGFSPPRAGVRASRRGNFGPPSLRPSLRPPPLACGCARTLGDIHVAPTFPVVSVSRIENSISRPVKTISRLVFPVSRLVFPVSRLVRPGRRSAILGAPGRKTPGLCRRLAGAGRNFASSHQKTTI